VVVFGGADLCHRDTFAYAEDPRTLTEKSVDAFEISELNVGTSLYETILREGICIECPQASSQQIS